MLASLRWTCPTWGEPRRSTKLANDLTRTHLPTASVFIGFIWFSLMFIDFHMICIGVHWFSLISTYMIVQWCRDWGHQEPCQCDCQAWSTSKSIVEWCLLCFMGKSMSPFSGYGAMSCIGYWFSLIFIWCILIFISFHMVIDFHRFHWFSSCLLMNSISCNMSFMDFHGFTLLQFAPELLACMTVCLPGCLLGCLCVHCFFISFHGFPLIFIDFHRSVDVFS